MFPAAELCVEQYTVAMVLYLARYRSFAFYMVMEPISKQILMSRVGTVEVWISALQSFGKIPWHILLVIVR